MAIKFWWTCESAAISTGDYSAGDTSAAEYLITHNATSMKLGTNGIVTGGQYAQAVFASASIVTAAEGRAGFWLQIKTWGTDPIFGVRLTENNIIAFMLNSTNKFRGIYNGVYTGASTNNFVINTWYFCEIAWKQSTNLFKIYVNGTEEASSGDALTSSSVDDFFIGTLDSNGAIVWLDNLIIVDDSAANLYSLYSTVDDYPGEGEGGGGNIPKIMNHQRMMKVA